jgi:hypothetical protein
MAWVYSKTWAFGEVLTHTDLNQNFADVQTNYTPQGMGDYSASTSQMRAQTDPYPASSESLAVDMAGELERIRYVIAQIIGETYWYIDPDASIAGIIAGTATVGAATTATTATNSAGTGTSIYSEETGLKVIRGSIASSVPTILAGSGFSVVKNSTGVNTITFTSSFSARPSVVVSIENDAGAGGYVWVADTPSTSSFVIHTGDTNHGAYDNHYSFIAIGPK